MNSDLVINRLLNSNEPSVRYLAATGICGKDKNDPEVCQMREDIRCSERVQTMLAGRLPDGKFPWHAYAKWRGAFWALLLFADMGYPPGDESLIPLRDQVLGWLLDESRLKRVPQIKGLFRRCALQEATAVLTMIKLEIIDPRIEQLIELLLKWQWPDGGWNCDKKTQVSHSSFYETWLPLRAMNAYACLTGDPKARSAVEKASEVFLCRHLYKRLSNGEVMEDQFTKLAYPPYWHYDILVGLRVMNEIGKLDDPRCEDALDLLESKRQPDGGFAADIKYYRVTNRETSGVSTVGWGFVNGKKMNEFVTVRALTVLKQAGRLK